MLQKHETKTWKEKESMPERRQGSLQNKKYPAIKKNTTQVFHIDLEEVLKFPFMLKAPISDPHFQLSKPSDLQIGRSLARDVFFFCLGWALCAFSFPETTTTSDPQSL